MKKSSFFKEFINRPHLLIWYYILINMVPSIYFFFNQPTDFSGRIITLLFPLGLYLLLFSLIKNTGKWQIFLFPLSFLHAFQIVLFYLYGEGVIASDMFLNVVTTNSSEIDELLGALLPSIFIVCILYIPPLIIGIRQWRKHFVPAKRYRKKIRVAALVLLVLSFSFFFTASNTNGSSYSFQKNVYPINAFYNLGFAVYKNNKIKALPETTKDFSFHATRKRQDSLRQIIVFVIGETSRADNWELYGYQRATNPKLKKLQNLIVYKDAVTQANVTHKSVAILMSSVGAEDYAHIYQRKGVFEAFNEVGFTTAFLSNQTESSFIEFFGKEADIYKTIRTADSKNSYDEELLPLMQQVIDRNEGDIFIVLHTYGSHFNYRERYPKAFQKYRPDSITNVTKSQKEQLVNAYDNSILYTDFFLDKAIKQLQSTTASTALLYSADHGEDLFDDQRGKFLHSSPNPTYYQLRIPVLLWLSETYQKQNPKAYSTALQNKNLPIATNSIFPTLLDLGNIQSPYLKGNLSLIHPKLNVGQRMYLNDHDQAIPFQKMNLKEPDFIMLKKNHIKYE